MIEVIQVNPRDDFKVYVYFNDGRIVLYDMNQSIQKGGVFERISSIDIFMDRCTVMNGTLAWDISGVFDPSLCIDIDPETIYNAGCLLTEDPLENKVS